MGALVTGGRQVGGTPGEILRHRGSAELRVAVRCKGSE